MTAEALKQAIEKQTQAILAAVTAEQVDDVAPLIDERMQHITHLIALSPAEISPEALSLFLKTVLAMDEKITLMVTAQRALIKTTLQNYNSLQNYLNV